MRNSESGPMKASSQWPRLIDQGSICRLTAPLAEFCSGLAVGGALRPDWPAFLQCRGTNSLSQPDRQSPRCDLTEARSDDPAETDCRPVGPSPRLALSKAARGLASAGMSSLFDLTGRDIWIVGGAGYLGTAVVKALVQHGATVRCADLADRAQTMVEREKLAAGVTPETLDAGDDAETLRFVRDGLAQRGVPAGLVVMTYKSFPKSVSALQPADFDAANHVNLTSSFILAREVGEAMAEKGRGSVVIFSSMYGTVAPDPGMYPAPILPNPIEYGVGKAGLQQMARYLGVHWAPRGVRCNTISPGPFPFPSMQEGNPEWMARLRAHCPMGRVGRPDEMAGTVIYLLADASSYVTGHNVAVDGGWTAW